MNTDSANPTSGQFNPGKSSYLLWSYESEHCDEHALLNIEPGGDLLLRCIDFGSAFDDCEESSYDFSRNYLIRADQIPVIYRALGGDPDSAPPERIRQKIVAAMTECIRGAASAKALLDKWGVNYESFVPAR